MHRHFIQTWNAARRFIIAVVGGTVVLLGVVLIVTPGPAVVVIPAGLAILSLEFAWARRLRRRFLSMLPPRRKRILERLASLRRIAAARARRKLLHDG